MSMKHNFTFIDTDLQNPINFGINEITQKNLNKSISSKFKRILKKDFIDFLLAKVPIDKKIFCNWCGRPNVTCKGIYGIDFSNMTVSLMDIEYSKKLHCCYGTTECQSKKLNPNSIEFVSKSRNLSLEEAREYILNRNKSPFYSRNHKTLDDYKKYQGSRCFSDDVERNKEIINKQNFSRSLDGFKEKYGPIEGQQKYDLYQSKKAITLENLIKKYDDPKVAEEKLLSWKRSTSLTLENCIRRHGPVEGPKYYKKSVENGGLYSTITFAYDGSALRSNNERKFYELLLVAGIPKEEILIDNCYPESALRYDFFIKCLGIFIEIAGMNDDQYNEKMILKNKTFNAWIVRPLEIDKAATKIIEYYNFLKEEK